MDVYLNGELIPYEQACIPVNDHGFLYGYGLFETMRAYNGRIFLLERHLERLRRGAAVIGLGSLDGIDFARACRDVMEANKLGDARLRITVSGGAADEHPWSVTAVKPTVLVTGGPYTPFSEKKYREGFKVGLATMRRCRQSFTAGVKSISYLDSVLARKEAAGRGMDEAMFLNDDGYIAEGGSSNLFFVRSSRLVTPSPESGMLPGITRQAVMGLAGEMDVVVTEGTVGLAILRQCEEAFITNSVIEVMPVAAFTDNAGRTMRIGDGKPGKITRKLIAAYREMVARETET